MDHSFAQSIFEEIQARPYRVSTVPNVSADNCYYKGMEFIRRVGSLGYPVRARVGKMLWESDIFPQEILDLMHPDIEYTHYYPEVMIDGEWRIVDPTFQPALAKHGLYIGSWEGTPRSCCTVTKLFSHEENIAYQIRDLKPENLKNFFTKGAPFWNALNKFFEGLEKKDA